MSIHHHIIIIGAGPIGLYFASKCENDKKDYVILEASNEIGGQLTRLYPSKDIVDVNMFECIKAKDLIDDFAKKVNRENILSNQKVKDIKPGKIIEVVTNQEIFTCDYLIISTGLGSSTPRPLGIENENKAKNIIYQLHDITGLKNKRIAIFGGGDSALDWAKHLSQISDNVHLIHRRTEFRGNPDTIKGCHNLNVHLPFVPDHINLVGDKAISVTIKEVVSDEKTPQFLDIPVDLIFVNYGNVAEQSDFNFDKDGAFLKVDKNDFSVSNNVFAIGDVASYENKKRRIQPGINEADRVYKIIS